VDTNLKACCTQDRAHRKLAFGLVADMVRRRTGNNPERITKALAMITFRRPVFVYALLMIPVAYVMGITSPSGASFSTSCADGGGADPAGPTCCT
jgi:ABC-type dipeptide/oligopeptide/nickel transport system permease component